MAKDKKHILNKRPCRLCGTPFAEDKIKCPSCGQWNTGASANELTDGIIRLSEVAKKRKTERLITGPWDECFGKPPQHGIPTTAVTLISGAPGAGKSTVSLQMAFSLASLFIKRKTPKDILYIAAEEDEEQVEERAIRLKIMDVAEHVLLYTMNSSSDLAGVIEHYKPGAIILDSLPGLLGDNLEAQVNICHNLKAFSVQLNAPSIVINQVNKGDEAAGLMKLQHAVDITMSLFPIDDVTVEQHEQYEELIGMEIDDKIREMITVKNRYGWANKSLIFAMTERGLVLIPEDEIEEEEDE